MPPSCKVRSLAAHPNHTTRAKILGLKGVRQIVPLPNAVAVVADSWWQAKTAVDALPVTWDEGQNGKVSDAEIAAILRDGLAAPEAAVVRKDGDVDAALPRAAKASRRNTPHLIWPTRQWSRRTARHM